MKPKNDPLRYPLALLYALSIGCFLYFLSHGMSYYLTPSAQRPFHGDFRIYKPAGSQGLLFGVVGTLMLLALLLYSLRKRTRIFGNLFHLKHWLSVHIFLGISGPLFILLHTSFKLNGLVAVSFWAMVAVFASGLLGRYLYIQIPRTIEGKEMGMTELKKISGSLETSLHRDFGLQQEHVKSLISLLQVSPPGQEQGLWAMISADLKSKWLLPRARAKIARQFQISPHQARALLQTARRQTTLQRRISRLRKVHTLFHYWHVLHRPFALVMYLIMMVHIAIALLFGISWRSAS